MKAILGAVFVVAFCVGCGGPMEDETLTGVQTSQQALDTSAFNGMPLPGLNNAAPELVPAQQLIAAPAQPPPPSQLAPIEERFFYKVGGGGGHGHCPGH